MSDFVLECWKSIKLCFIIEKMLGLSRSYVAVKGIILSMLVVLGCLKTSRGISLAFNMLASIISNLGCFCFIDFLQLFGEFFFHIFILSNGTYSTCDRMVYLLNSE